MKIQTLYKRLSMPLLLTVISATGIGVSSPARSASLIGFQSTAIDTNPEATLIAGRVPPCKKGQMPPGCNPGHTQAQPEPDPSSSQKLEIDNRVRQQQRKLEQQQRESQQQRELEQQPTVEPLPEN
jgi:hypothetical protein